jgi:non-heme chloroperoxidase
MPEQRPFKTSRRTVLVGGAAFAGVASLPAWSMADAARPDASTVLCNAKNGKERLDMNSVTTKDGVEIFYKDWGAGTPIVFSHGWPLSADNWDAQMLFFLERGFRVIAHDRRGHGRSTQTGSGHDMDHYALKGAVHVGHSTGGGEVMHYLARHGESRVAKALIISAVPPPMVKTAGNPGGLPKEVFDALQTQLAANPAQFYYDVPAGPFYGYNRPAAKPSQGVIWNWWRRGMMGGAKAHYDGIAHGVIRKNSTCREANIKYKRQSPRRVPTTSHYVLADDPRPTPPVAPSFRIITLRECRPDDWAGRHRAGKINFSWRVLEEGVFHIDIEVPQQGVRNERVVPGSKVVLQCIGERRTCVEQVFNSN